MPREGDITSQDIESFFRAVLPADGLYFLCLMDERGRVEHLAYNDIASMSEAVTKYDNTAGLTVYHACAAYNQPYVNSIDREGKPKKKYRIPENLSSAKALWMDLDVGAEKAANGKG